MQFTTDIVSLLASNSLRNMLPTSENQVQCMLNLHQDREAPFLHANKLHQFTLRVCCWCLKEISEASSDKLHEEFNRI